jgi:uroporphyrinogen decarboxylase
VRQVEVDGVGLQAAQRISDGLGNPAFGQATLHVVNCPLEVGGKRMTPREASALFGRLFMGGLERKGVLATGAPAEVRRAAQTVPAQAPARFILAADCTVPADTSWVNLQAAVQVAHGEALPSA